MLKPFVETVTHAKIKFVPGLDDRPRLRRKLEALMDKEMVEW